MWWTRRIGISAGSTDYSELITFLLVFQSLPPSEMPGNRDEQGRGTAREGAEELEFKTTADDVRARGQS